MRKFDWWKKGAPFSELNFVSDFHCHILPDVDDGVKSIGESLNALEEMRTMGICSVVLTPHINPEIYPLNTEDYIASRFNDFIRSVPDDVLSSINISLGAEYMVTSSFEERDMSELLQFSPGKVLIEMSYLYASDNMEKAIFSIILAGLKPVISHPERYIYLADSLETFERYHDMGAEFQLNLLSLCGKYGPESLKILRFLLKKGWYSHSGTDAHNTDTLQSISRMEISREFLNLYRHCTLDDSPTSPH